MPPLAEVGADRRVERHRSNRMGWLRAAVLGANDGIVSTASLMPGVGAAGADHRTLLLASVSGLIAGAHLCQTWTGPPACRPAGR